MILVFKDVQHSKLHKLAIKGAHHLKKFSQGQKYQINDQPVANSCCE